MEKGKEQWFACEVALPNWGLDPSRDCNHVDNSELDNMFGERKKKIGYFYPNAKSSRVLQRINELYPAIYQCPGMPKNQCISESFARAIVSEVCHGHPMNWAQYAEDRWRVKKSKKKKKETIIRYGAPVSKDSYYRLVKAKFEEYLAKTELLHSEVEADYSDRHIFIHTLMKKPKNPATGDEAKRIQKVISRLREKIQASEGLLEDIVDSGQQKQKRTEEEERIVNLKYKLKKKEIAMVDTKGEINEAMEEINRLQAVMEDLQEKSDRLRDKLKKMAKLLHIPLAMQTSHHVDGHTSSRSSFQLNVKPCPLCDSSFPGMDVIVASCKCTYHPWCIVMQSILEDECADKECKEKFTDSWKKSLGLDRIPEYYLDTTPSQSQQPKRKRKHTNSDIGGVNFSKKKRNR